jgi:hypothetical protein
MPDGGEKSADGVISEEAGKLVNVQAQVDSRTKLFALHDFDLDISLAGLGNIEGPGGVHNGFMLAYMARKGQLEPTCSGVQVSDQGLLAPLSFSLSGGMSSISMNQVHNCVTQSQHIEEPFQRVDLQAGTEVVWKHI